MICLLWFLVQVIHMHAHTQTWHFSYTVNFTRDAWNITKHKLSTITLLQKVVVNMNMDIYCNSIYVTHKFLFFKIYGTGMLCSGGVTQCRSCDVLHDCFCGLEYKCLITFFWALVNMLCHIYTVQVTVRAILNHLYSKKYLYSVQSRHLKHQEGA